MIKFVKDTQGNKFWLKNEKFHRVGFPAIIWNTGDTAWYNNGLLHRLDGPALIIKSGTKQWYYQGEFITSSSQEDFNRFIKLLAFK